MHAKANVRVELTINTDFAYNTWYPSSNWKVENENVNFGRQVQLPPTAIVGIEPA